MWLWSQRFLRDDSLEKMSALPHEPFLAVLFPSGSTLPLFYDFFVPLEAPLTSLDFVILSAACPCSQIRDGLSVLPLAPPSRQYVLDAFAGAQQRFEGGTGEDAATEMFPRPCRPSLRAHCPGEGGGRVLPEVPDVSLLPDHSLIFSDAGTSDGAANRLLSGSEMAQPKFPAAVKVSRAPADFFVSAGVRTLDLPSVSPPP